MPDENGDQTVSGGVITGGKAGVNYISPVEGEIPGESKEGLITNGTFYGEVTNAFSSEISGGSFYGKVDNRDRSDFRPMYQGILAGGTFYAGGTGTLTITNCINAVTVTGSEAAGCHHLSHRWEHGRQVQPHHL